ncbi:transglycosylase domain-containing protein, partial [Kitasatospora nipponensis]|uniref:transglycosylase domain-containing protein n=1 Tax=Kitasatospora nipponensis TaxID=258049 RepID=UPI0031D8E34A
QTVARKVKELFIAVKVDATETKDEVLAGYLNTSYYGRGAYGIQAPAQAYYGIDATQLNAAQGAYLAALLQAPSAYDVKNSTPANQAKALARWNYVLDGMVQLGFLDAATRAATTFPEPIDPQPATGLSGQAGYLVDIADDYLTSTNVLDAATLKAGGWKITTTFDKPRQDAHTAARVSGASVEPASGKIVAVYGGPDYAKQQYNDAVRQDNQVGSTFKPIDLAAGLDGEHTTQDGRPITTQT